MDVETFSDTECIQNKGIKMDDDLMDGFDEYMKIMDRHNIKSTLFVLGSLAPKIADRLKTHLRNGHALALHGSQHIPPMFIPAEQFRADIQHSKAQMQELFDTPITGFRAPCFSIDKARLDILRELGFQYDSSYLNFPMARHTTNLDLKDFKKTRKNIFRLNNFYEFGLSKGTALGIPFPISGGGYVRLGHWWFVKILIKQYLRKNDYYVFYVHPFELSKKKIPFVKGMRLHEKYYLHEGVRFYHKRIESIIELLKKHGYEFVTFEQLIPIVEEEHPSCP